MNQLNRKFLYKKNEMMGLEIIFNHRTIVPFNKIPYKKFNKKYCQKLLSLYRSRIKDKFGR